MDEKLSPPNDSARITTLLAYERTRAASERTLMAWMRTSLSLISFGFSIATFFRSFREAQGLPPLHFSSEPVILGLVLIFLGMSVLAFGGLQEYQSMRKSRELVKHISQTNVWSVSFVFALSLFFVGLAVFVYLIFKSLH